MKHFYSIFLAVILAAGIVFFISQSTNPAGLDLPTGQAGLKSRPTSTEYATEGMSVGGRIEYEFNRLRDPATGKIPANIRRLELEYAATLPGFISPLQRGTKGDLFSTLNWESRGPWNVGGRTRAFAIDVANPNKFIAGSTSGGMWTSTNGGTSWTQNWTAIHQSVSCISQDTRAGKTNTWYIGTGEGYGQSASGGNAYYLGNGIYKSTDEGQTWNSLTSTVSGTPQTFDNVWDIVWNVATNPANAVNDVVYAASYGAIFKSINGGTSWTVARGSASSGPYSYFSDVAVTPSGVVYATLSEETFAAGPGPQRGIWRSADGITWTNISLSAVGFPTTYGRVKIGISPSDSNQVYFWAGTTSGIGTFQCDTNFLGTIECNSLWKYKYVSGNGSGTGGIWWNLSQNLPTTGGPHDKQHVQGGYNMVIKVHPTDTAVVVLGGTNLYRSDDGFFSPTKTKMIGGYKEGSSIPYTINTYLNHHPDQHEIVFDKLNPDIMYSANDGGIHKTTNDTASTVVWTPLNNGYLTSMFYTVALDHAATNDSTIIGGTQDNNSWFVNSQNPQTPWATVFFGDGSYCAIANNKLNYYFSIQNGKMQKMNLDVAGNVTARRRIDPIGGKGYLFINPYILDPNNNNVMYLAGGKNLWRNNNLNLITLVSPTSPSGWDSISTGWTMFPDTVPTSGARITALAVSNNPANVLYYGTSNRRVYRIDNANVGTPIATDITGTVSPNQFPLGANVSCIAIDPTDSRKVMVAFSNYNVYSIFYTTRADSSAPPWIKVAGNLEASSNLTGSGSGSSVRWVSIMPVSDGVVYLAATSTGLYATDTLISPSATMSPVVWTQQGASTIGNSICDMIDFRTTDGLVAVATHSRGIFTTNITSKNDVLTVNDIQPRALGVGLTNYPNPFSSSTTISFTLNKNSKVKLNIYDINGRFIKTLADKEFSSGENRVEFSGEKLSSGIYYCVMKAGEAIKTKKMILMK